MQPQQGTPGTPGPVELTRGAYDALNRQDFDAVMELFGPASVWDVSRWGLGTHRGRDAIRRFLNDWFGSLDEYEVRVEDLLDVGEGVVSAVVLQTGHGGGRGYIRLRSAPVYVWLAGQIGRLTVYTEIEEGRAAARQAAARMPQRNLDVHARACAAVNAREVPTDILDSGFSMENRASAVTDQTYHGARGWGEWMSDVFEVFADGAVYSLDDVVACGEDFVVATFSVVGTGARSAEPLEFRWAGVTWFRDGKATRAVGYTTRREALEAVGLRE